MQEKNGTSLVILKLKQNQGLDTYIYIIYPIRCPPILTPGYGAPKDWLRQEPPRPPGPKLLVGSRALALRRRGAGALSGPCLVGFFRVRLQGKQGM